ncbi:MAG TPA: FG-GAP-like repeat-containing protein [Pyrinomonadaceae bacterium]|nr:FG-GAP-like repeat-containing protein [Pyrinomonadaceae bacterium]
MRKFALQLSICLTIFLTFQTIAHAAGVIDRTFGTNGTLATGIGGINGFFGDVVFQTDGKFIALGSYYDNSMVIARFNKNGSLDTSFGTNGIVNFPLSSVSTFDAELQSDGKIVVVGSVPVGNSRDFLVIRFNSNGTIDATFGNGGISTINQGVFDEFYAMAIQSDGKILAAGRTSDGGSRGAVIRFNANGSLDTTFADQGLFYYSFPTTSTTSYNGFYDLKILPNNRILVGATSFSSVNDNSFSNYFLLMLDGSGHIFTGFGTQGIATGGRNWYNGANDRINFEILPSGRIFVASIGGIYVLNQNGSLYKKLPFEGEKTTLFPDGRILVSSLFNDGLPNFSRIGNIKLYTEDHFIGKAANLPDGTAYALSDGKILLTGRDNSYNLTLTRLNLITSQGTRIADFDRDDKTDLAVYKAGYDGFSVRLSSTGYPFTTQERMTKIVPELFETRTPEGIIRRDAVLFWDNGVPFNVNPPRYAYFNQLGAFIYFGVWGLPDDKPVGGDYNGDASTDPTVFRPSSGDWYSMPDGNHPYRVFHWGANGDKPVPADYDYDGITDYAVYRPSTGTWWVHRSGDDSYFTLQFGVATDIPLTGDFDGDGKADFTVYRPSEGTWYQYLTTEGFRVVQFGLPTDIPAPGDYDGDGRHDLAFYRNGFWYLLQSTDGLRVMEWGSPMTWDIPVSVRYDQ